MRVDRSIHQIREWREKYAARIIAAGVFSHTDEEWTEILGRLCAADRSVRTAMKKAEEPLSPLDYADTAGPTLADALHESAIEVQTFSADVGFRLGLAVGMQLGPHAFDHIDTRRKTR